MELLSTDGAYWVVQTKLYPPRLRDTIVPRQRLLDRLVDGLLSHRLTLLAAPAGYGKTTLLASLSQALPELPLAWLTLDEDENHPVRFLAALIGALQRLNPVCGAAAQVWLPACANPVGQPIAEVRRVVGLLINEIIETLPAPFVLVLDDLHLMTEPLVLQALDYLLERLPPHMHIAAATRHEPPLALARLRARGHLASLRLPDLRFTPAETAALLNDVLSLDLSSADVAALHDRTEGWACGLSLLATSLDRLPTASSRSSFIARLGLSRLVFDYLAGEVLDRQEPAVRDFLLQTSILAELTPALCQAVTGCADAEAMLDDLYRRNLFLMAVDEPGDSILDATALLNGQAGLDPAQGRSYRYHALFAGFLRQRLQRDMPDRLPDLHCRAAQAHTVPSRIIFHYLAAGMWNEAAAMIGSVWLVSLHRGLVDTVAAWIRALPESACDAEPWMWYILGSCYLEYGDIERSQAYLERSLACWDRSTDTFGQTTAMALISTIAFIRCDYSYVQRLVDWGLSLDGSLYGRFCLLMASSWLALFVRHDRAAAQSDFEAALARCYETEEADPLFSMAFYLMQGLAIPASTVTRMEELCRFCLARAGGGPDPLQQSAEDSLAYVYLRRGQLASAGEAAERALATKEANGGYPLQGMNSLWIAAAAYTALGDYDRADRGFTLFDAEVRLVVRNGQLAAWGLYPLARMRWLQGQYDETRRYYATMCAFGAERETPLACLLRLMLCGLVEMADRNYPAAEFSLQRACRMEDEVPLSTIFGSPRLLLAHLYRVTRRPRAALALFGPLLAECAADDKAGVIVQEGVNAVLLLRLAVEQGVQAGYAARLLDLLQLSICPRTVRIPATGATLTAREVEVLQLLAAGASNRAIADQLVTSLPTVKSHVAHILAKFDVSSRADAAARARELRLV